MKIKLMGLFTMLCSMLACKAQTEGYKSLGVDEFAKAIEDSKVVRLDVRTAEEYAEGHIAMAMNIDVKQDDFEKKAKLALDKTKTIAVYCRSGNRSKKACQILTSNGYQVIELSSGIMGWTNAGKEVTKEEVDVFSTANGATVYMHCIKHGSLSIMVSTPSSDGQNGTVDKWIYIDPVTDKVQPITDYSSMPKADYILVTHEHADHLDAKAIEQLTKEGTKLIVNPRSSELLGGKGDVMKNGESITIATWTVDAVPAYNTSTDKQQFHPKGRDNGYILDIEGLRIYIAGDTEPTPEMQNIKDIDIALMPCNLPFTMTPEQLKEAASIVRPKVLFPYHYGKTDMQQVVNLMDGSGIDVRIRQYQ